jgi:hypothetical protein
VAIPSFDKPTHLVVMDDVDLRFPGAQRKLANLVEYRRIARALHPTAVVRGLVLTNARDGQSLGKLYAHLGAETQDFDIGDGWRLLPLEVVGGWVSLALQSQESSGVTPKMTLFLQDFVEWTKTLDPRISPKG